MGDEKIRNFIKKIPVLRSIARLVYFTVIEPFKSFPGSTEYWKKRYKSGGNSGAGSYQKFAEFKAKAINNFVKDKKIKTVIEFGCGDGNQLLFSDYISYIGFDISPEAISQCRHLFSNDKSKTFKLMDEYASETAQLTLSLDVIYHLIEDHVFTSYMNRLFESSKKYVIIYSSNTDTQSRLQGIHIKHRKFSNWIAQSKPDWDLIEHIPNKFPHSFDELKGSFADFYIYEKLNIGSNDSKN